MPINTHVVYVDANMSLDLSRISSLTESIWNSLSNYNRSAKLELSRQH